MNRRNFFRTLLGAGAAIAAPAMLTPAVDLRGWDSQVFELPDPLYAFIARVRISKKLLRAGALEAEALFAQLAHHTQRLDAEAQLRWLDRQTGWRESAEWHSFQRSPGHLEFLMALRDRCL